MCLLALGLGDSGDSAGITGICGGLLAGYVARRLARRPPYPEFAVDGDRLVGVPWAITAWFTVAGGLRWLELGPAGITSRTAGRRRFVPWAELGWPGLYSVEVPGEERISFDGTAVDVAVIRAAVRERLSTVTG
ncbi:hypothetical protein [Longispora albida]|uniref:hypothetical protein n=1 Tax=Longispora albida TaxID=203523 RepID=UPI0003720EF6|nr:hypothetical protein [Longispora albida]